MFFKWRKAESKDFKRNPRQDRGWGCKLAFIILNYERVWNSYKPTKSCRHRRAEQIFWQKWNSCWRWDVIWRMKFRFQLTIWWAASASWDERYENMRESSVQKFNQSRWKYTRMINRKLWYHFSHHHIASTSLILTNLSYIAYNSRK